MNSVVCSENKHNTSAVRMSWNNKRFGSFIMCFLLEPYDTQIPTWFVLFVTLQAFQTEKCWFRIQFWMSKIIEISEKTHWLIRKHWTEIKDTTMLRHLYLQLSVNEKRVEIVSAWCRFTVYLFCEAQYFVMIFSNQDRLGAPHFPRYFWSSYAKLMLIPRISSILRKFAKVYTNLTLTNKSV